MKSIRNTSVATNACIFFKCNLKYSSHSNLHTYIELYIGLFATCLPLGAQLCFTMLFHHVLPPYRSRNIKPNNNRLKHQNRYDNSQGFALICISWKAKNRNWNYTLLCLFLSESQSHNWGWEKWTLSLSHHYVDLGVN